MNRKPIIIASYIVLLLATLCLVLLSIALDFVFGPSPSERYSNRQLYFQHFLQENRQALEQAWPLVETSDLRSVNGLEVNHIVHDERIGVFFISNESNLFVDVGLLRLENDAFRPDESLTIERLEGHWFVYVKKT